ncbi:uncharacterized protein N7484_003176 [Penicillium longicatenatum]|uniref:uncharacterized protein n=1 Tax=Penicillium longicatenatum TaxID=1561947 RepID=UPI00254804EB|nr:uncharacterized protein N7484_003176 [Penicillium longicatenatum]KAJ5649453.1 hypothetical protein N7484_003176 [Penicillium longicatenatum]
MARMKHGVFSWEDVLAQRYQTESRYNEAIHLLYTLNTFEFSNPWSLPYMRPTIPTEHWDCIRNIELRWSFEGMGLPCKDPVRAIYISAGRAQWIETCRVLALLPTLKSFVLVLGRTWFSEPVEKLPVFLEPLRGLRVQRRSRAISRQVEAVDEYELGSGSSDEESSSSLRLGSRSSSSSSSSLSINVGGSGSASSKGTSTILHSYCSFYSSPPSSTSADTVPLPINKADGLAAWELRLQGQPYYVHELGRMGDDLRRRGIDCCISTM